MLIDWFTVAAQLLNFVVLVWLLKRFLYRPVLDAIDRREAGIAATLAGAAAEAADARRQRIDYTQQTAALERHRSELLRVATLAAQAEAAQILALAHREADAIAARRQAALEEAQRARQIALARGLREQVFATVRQVLHDLAGQTLERQIIDAFITRLRALAPAERTALATALPPGVMPLRLRSAFALSPEQHGALEQVLAEVLGHACAIAPELAPELMSGIELDTPGYQLGWNIDACLAAMHSQVAAAMASGPAAVPAAP